VTPTRREALAGAAALAVPAGGSAAEMIVDPSGRPGTVPTIAVALERIGVAGHPPRIRLSPGTYREKLTVTTPGLTITGAGAASVIEFGASNGAARPEGGNWGTGGSATLTIAAPGVTLERLTVRNSFDYLGARRDGAGNGAQAVALLVDRPADRTTIRDCVLEGYQDTFYLQPRTLVDRCRIVGGVDFIFGGAAGWFDRCTIVSRHVPNADPMGYVSAPSTPADQRFGLVFSRCRLEREPGVPDGAVWLGRPWRAGGNMALTGSSTFLDCWMDAHIERGGWTHMGYRGPAGDQHFLTPPEARLAEHGSRGPGAGEAGPDRRRLSDAEAAAFTHDAVLGGWRS
jgi:pectinesterase